MTPRSTQTLRSGLTAAEPNEAGSTIPQTVHTFPLLPCAHRAGSQPPQAAGAPPSPRQPRTCGWNRCDEPIVERGLCAIHEAMLDAQEPED